MTEYQFVRPLLTLNTVLDICILYVENEITLVYALQTF